MSHGPPPPPPPPGNLFGFGQQMGMPDMNAVGMNDQDMMSYLDNPMFGFDTMPMSLDNTDDAGMSTAFNPSPVVATSPQNQGTQGMASGGPFMDAQTYQPNPADENIPGAGPPPMSGYGVSQNTALPSGSTVTDFTKRRNWPAKVVEELKDLLLILDANGRIKYASPSSVAMTGYTPDELSEQFLRSYIHPDDNGLFVTELNESIASGNTLRMFYRFRRKDGNFVIFESVGHSHIASAKFAPNPSNQSPFCQAVFIMSRLYPATNAKLLDSFLDHKMTNERLRARIAELRKEEEAEAEEASRWQSQESRSEFAPSDGDTNMTPVANASFYRNADSIAMPPPEKPDARNNNPLTRKNIEDVTAGSRPESIRDKMDRYSGGGIGAIEMLTGLRYREGERSKGITTGNASPTLIKGDAGIAIPVDKDPRTGEKKKKSKVAEEYVCTDCGTLDSPEWRKGPSGPKTLCNACGLRWAKKEKKRQQLESTGGGLSGGGGAGPAGGMGGAMSHVEPGQA